jgi:hypothetical protein
MTLSPLSKDVKYHIIQGEPLTKSTLRYQPFSDGSDLIIAKEIATAERAYYGLSG